MENKIDKLEHVQSRHFSFSPYSSSRRDTVILLIFVKMLCKACLVLCIFCHSVQNVWALFAGLNF